MTTGIFLNGAILTKPDDEDFQRLGVAAYEAYREVGQFDTPFQMQPPRVQQAWVAAGRRVWAEIAKRGGASERGLSAPE